MNVPFLSYDQLKAEAAQVLLQSSYASRFPVAIELIVERDFKMDVVPIRGLQTAFNIDAFILVPEESLDRRFGIAVQRIKAEGLNPAEFPDECLDSIATGLGKQFEVSRDVVLNRLNNKHEDFLTRLR
jgi:hypothetical protein